jgi:hypothetical protein
VPELGLISASMDCTIKTFDLAREKVVQTCDLHTKGVKDFVYCRWGLAHVLQAGGVCKTVLMRSIPEVALRMLLVNHHHRIPTPPHYAPHTC